MRHMVGHTTVVLLAWATAAGGIVGCTIAPPAESGGTVPSEPTDDNDTSPGSGAGGGDGVDPAGFSFPEDADPRVAALPFVEDELLVRSLPGAEAEDLRTAYEEVGGTVVQDLPTIQTTVLRVVPAELAEVAEALSTNPLLEAVQKNYFYAPEKTPDDPRFGSQDYLRNIGLEDAWEITTGSDDVVIAVLDTGVTVDHPDLTGKLLNGWNAYDDNSETDDVLGHGTSVAGVVAAASDNGTGIAGVSWASPILPVRVTNENGQASSRSIAAGLVWAVDHGATVINVSFAPLGSDKTVARAARYVRNAGGLVFISAGNDGQTSEATGTVNALFVGAVTGSNKLASFSTTGPFIDLAAPGVRIEATHLDGGYAGVTGTSFASPIAAGVAALIWAVRPELRPVTVEDILAETTIDLGAAGHDDEFGAGLIDAADAVTMALDITDQTDEYPPWVRITAPDDHQAVSGTINVKANAFDADDLENSTRYVADVVLSVDGVPFATDTAAPFKFAVDTTRLSPGIHALTCEAHDTAGNTSRPESIEIIVSDGAQDGGGGGTSGPDGIDPAAVINYPVEGTRVSSRVAIGATLTDNAGLNRVEWLVDGAIRQTDSLSGTRAVVSFVWDAERASRGTHTITVRATDTVGNRGTASVGLIRE